MTTAPAPQPAKTPDLGSLLRKPATTTTTTTTTPTSTPDKTPTKTPTKTPPRSIRTAAPDLPPPPPSSSGSPGSSGQDVPSGAVTLAPDAVARAAPRERSTGSGRGYLRSIQVQLPRTVHAHLADVARQRGTTATALMLEAVNATHDQLAATLAAAHGAGPAGSTGSTGAGGSLFAVPQARAKTEPAVATTIRITDAQHEAFERLTRQLQTNRSAVITAAVRAYL